MVDATVFASEQDAEAASPGPSGTASPGPLGRLIRYFFKGARAKLNGNGGTLPSGNSSVADLLRTHSDSDRPLNETERSMLLNLLKFRSVRVEDVMVPRANVIAVEVDTPFADLVAVFKEAGHSRLPIYRQTLDDPLGMVHIKDVLACFQAGDGEDGKEGPACIEPPPGVARLKRDVLFVPPSMPVSDLLVQMQTARIHMALVIDEYGGTDGLVTIEDLVETIVGDIEDEHDADDILECVALEGGGYQVDARLEIADFEEQTNLSLNLPEMDTEEIDTLGGLVFTLAGRVPRRGEIIRHPGGYDLEIVEADPRRIRRLRVVPQAVRTEAGAPAESTAAAPASPADNGT